MASLRRWRALSPEDRRLTLRAFGIVVGVRVALSLLPYRAWHALYAPARRVPRSGRRATAPSPERIALAVRRAARLVPGASCLTRAIAAQRMLVLAGHPASLRVGVRRDGRRLAAHAWIEDGHGIVIGGLQSGEFQRLAPLAGKAG